MNGRIVLDATYSVGTNRSGVGVYCYEILTGLCANYPAQRFVAAFRSQRFLRSFQERLPRNCGRTLLWDRGMLGTGRLFHGLNQRMPRFRDGRTCCTFHDLFVMTGNYSTAEFRERFTEQAREAAKRSDLVVCVSHFAAEQVHSLLGVERARLRVVHHGVREAAASPEQREPIILCVGALQHRKNIVRLVGAFERAAGPPWRLVLAGSQGYGAGEILKRIEASPARERIGVTGYVDDSTLRSLYSRAKIFAFPSLDEGFGLPVLEAMSHGAPVLGSNVSAVPEVCGSAALLVDPMSEAEIEAGLRRLIEDPELARKLVERGHARALEFTWDRAVGQTWEVYRELL